MGLKKTHQALKSLKPTRKHYIKHFGQRDAEDNMPKAIGGFKNFLRPYLHCKSAGWSGKNLYTLKGWTAIELAKIPKYYIMNEEDGIAETALLMAPDKDT